MRRSKFLRILSPAVLASSVACLLCSSVVYATQCYSIFTVGCCEAIRLAGDYPCTQCNLFSTTWRCCYDPADDVESATYTLPASSGYDISRWAAVECECNAKDVLGCGLTYGHCFWGSYTVHLTKYTGDPENLPDPTCG